MKICPTSAVLPHFPLTSLVIWAITFPAPYRDIFMNTFLRPVRLLSGLMLGGLFLTTLQTARAADSAPKLKALIVDGQNNHGWQATTPILKAALESSGRFTVDVATSPPAAGRGRRGAAAGATNAPPVARPTMADFKPDFSKYDVIIGNYNGQDWSPETKTAFENYMKNGGGYVSVHAADNSFPRWDEYNKMIGVGGWGNRNQDSGDMIRWRDGKAVNEKGDPGPRGNHKANFSWVLDVRDQEHPIMKGLPARWKHANDELYATLAGPAENVTVLGTANSDLTHLDEPILMVINYGKGRIFHTTMGHDPVSMKDVGFVTVLDRGAEWAATGKVTIPVPANFPTADAVSVWTPPAMN